MYGILAVIANCIGGMMTMAALREFMETEDWAAKMGFGDNNTWRSCGWEQNDDQLGLVMFEPGAPLFK